MTTVAARFAAGKKARGRGSTVNRHQGGWGWDAKNVLHGNASKMTTIEAQNRENEGGAKHYACPKV